MNKLKKLETKKLLKELEFFESEFDYKNEIICEADSDFLKYVDNFLKKNPNLKEVYDKIVNNKIDQIIKNKKYNSEIDKNLHNEEVPKKNDNNFQETNKSTKLKKLYREIVKLTHPDKVNNKKLNNIYIKATSSYNNNDITSIYSICDNLNIDYEIDDEDNYLISDKIKNIKQKIEFIESTFTWRWIYSKSQEEKDNIILKFIKTQIS
jgi:hypothetical protein